MIIRVKSLDYFDLTKRLCTAVSLFVFVCAYVDYEILEIHVLLSA